jgi:medium-chain acyl-[acyl-carrier-protein] hydrolase
MLQFSATSNDKALRLFSIPHAGGGPSVYRGWREALAPEFDLIVAELPGREGRFGEPQYQRIDDVVNALTNAVVPVVRDGRPFAFFGNSLGGLIAFETLHAIRQITGLEAEHLFVSSVGAPHLHHSLPPMSHLSDEELVREICERYGSIPSAVLEDAELMAAMLPILRADVSVIESYCPRAPRPLSCGITAFSGSRDRTVSASNVRAWREQTTSSFNHVVLDEDHLYLQSARDYLITHVREILLGQQRVV